MDAPSPTPAITQPDRISVLEARVLGCLIEKELSTPDYYPLTLNALINACNQKNNRDPVMSLAAHDVEVALDALRQRRLAGLFAGAEARVPKFKHTLDLVYPMEIPDRAVLAELLLRGPQTGGELRGRCERMHPFASVDQVDEVLARLAGRPAGPLVERQARQVGQKEARWSQLLAESTAALHEESGAPSGAGTSSASAPLSVAVKVALPPEAEARFAALEAEVARLSSELESLRRALGD